MGKRSKRQKKKAQQRIQKASSAPKTAAVSPKAKAKSTASPSPIAPEKRSRATTSPPLPVMVEAEPTLTDVEEIRIRRAPEPPSAPTVEIGSPIELVPRALTKGSHPGPTAKPFPNTVSVSPFVNEFFPQRHHGFLKRAWQSIPPSVRRGLGATACVGVGIALIVYSWQAVNRTAVRAREAVSTIDRAVALGTYRIDDLEGIDRTVRGFFLAPNWQAQLPFVRAPEQVKTQMATWPYEPFKSVERGTVSSVSFNGLPFVDTTVTLQPFEEKRRIILERVGNGYKIDWEVAVGYQEQSWESFTTTQSTDPKRFRVAILRGDYYNWEFADSLKVVCWKIVHPMRPDLSLFGYTPINAPITERMLDGTLNPSNAFVAIADLAYPESPKDSQQVWIKELVQEGWVLDYSANHQREPAPNQMPKTAVGDR